MNSSNSIKDLLEGVNKEVIAAAGVVGTVAAVAAVGHFRNHNLPHIHRQGRVQKHPHEDRSELSSKNVRFGAMLAGVSTLLLGMASHGKIKRNLKRNLFFGTTFGIEALTDIVRGDDPISAIIGNSISVAAGYAAYKGGKALSLVGLASLKTAISTSSEGSLLRKTASSIEGITSRFPILKQLITPESMGLLSAVASIPFAHSIIHKTNFVHHRSYSNHSQISFLPSQQHNQAGETTGRTSTGTIPVSTNTTGSQFNLTSTLNTHYSRLRRGDLTQTLRI